MTQNKALPAKDEMVEVKMREMTGAATIDRERCIQQRHT